MELRHGYTLADLHRFAKLAVARTGQWASDVQHRYDTAWSAIAEHLYAADSPPAGWDLIYAGRDAIWRWLGGERQAHGIARLRGADEHHLMPRAVIYWQQHTTVPSPEDAIVERLSLSQAVAALPQRQGEALLAVAAYGSATAAAHALGIGVRTFQARVQGGRLAVLQALHGDERPVVPVVKPHRQPGRLQPCGTMAAYFRHRKRGETTDPECQRAWREYRFARQAARGGDLR